MRRISVVLLVALSLPIAAPQAYPLASGDPMTSLPPDRSVERPDLETALRLAFGMPRIAAANAYLSRAMVVESIYQATILSGAGMMGRVMQTGTLQPGFGGAYQYSAQPSDRLVLHYGGQIHEFVVHEVMGNNQAMNADAWILSPHQLRYTHRIPGQAEAELTVRFDGSAFETAVTGWTTQWNERYELSLRASGQVGGVRDYGGQDTKTTYDLNGTIRGDGLQLEVNERHTSTLVSATSLRLLPSQRGSASSSLSTLANVFILEGVRYELRDVQVQSGTRTRGFEGSGGMSGLSGSVLRDGQPFGQFVSRGGRPFLDTADGSISMDGLPG